MNKSSGSTVILGHTGFIGEAVSRSLASEGHNVIAASSRDCNLLDFASAAAFFSAVPDGSGAVFCSVINKNVDNTFDALKKNLIMADNFIRAVADKRLSSVVYLGAADIYGGKPVLPITESTLPRPESHYAMAKLCCEELLRMPKAMRCPVSILRLPGVYGPGDRGKSIVGRFEDAIRNGRPINIHGDGGTRRDFVHVSNVCEIISAALKKPFGGVLNVATGESMSIMEVAEAIGEAVGKEPIIEYGAPDPAAAGDLVFDNAALKMMFPEIKFIGLREGCKSYA